MGLFKTANIVSRADKISNFTVSTAEYGSAVMELLVQRVSAVTLFIMMTLQPMSTGKPSAPARAAV